MKVQMKIDVLVGEIDKNITFFDRRRHRNKKKAFWLKIVSIAISAIITFLIGLKGADNNNIVSNITLGLAAGITIVNGIDAFYNHRGLWEKDVRTLSNLKELKLDIDYYTAGEVADDLSLKVINEYQKRLQRILSEDIKTWSDTRTETKSEENNN